MEFVKCALCGAENDETLFIGHDEWYHQPGDFPVKRCRECHLIYLNPRPTKAEIGQYYPAVYEPYLSAIEDESSRFRRWERRYGMYKNLRVVTRRVSQQGRALDIGCATGNFLVALSQAGWEVAGVDTSQVAVDYARSRFGLDVYHGELDEANYPDQHFDLVTLWNVLEHVYDPGQLLKETARITKPGGTLMFSVPNLDSFEARLFGRYWAGWDVPRHLHIFSQDVIRRYLKESGWELTEIFCMTGRMWLFNLSLQHWLQNEVKSESKRHWIMGLAKSIPVRLIMLPYFAVVERLKKGSITAVVATRKSDKLNDEESVL